MQAGERGPLLLAHVYAHLQHVPEHTGLLALAQA